jgi:hypothetical protein
MTLSFVSYFIRNRLSIFVFGIESCAFFDFIVGQSARETIGKMPPEIIRPFRQGKNARQANVPKTANPFSSATKDSYNWNLGWESMDLDLLIASTPIPDESLIAEAENLIPKGSYWCGHELNRTLHYYIEDCRTGDKELIKRDEKWLRKAIVYARLEAAGLPVLR